MEIVNEYIYLKYKKEEVNIIFNRDILVNETQVINDCLKSLNILSKETIIAQHPWVSNIEIELLKIKQEEDNYSDFNQEKEI